ncbi:MAG: YraN family protein [Gemmatimonadetes bacterium]|nr:MAG: YraN family protein [Gemmatimonadota bacterium]
MASNRRRFGAQNEERAAVFLQQKGYTILERNFRTPYAEIDLIAKDGDTLVFVEVKARRSMRFGHPAAAVTPHKQQRIIHAAAIYLQQQDISDCACRFDVIAIHVRPDEVRIEHFPHAFIDEQAY